VSLMSRAASLLNRSLATAAGVEVVYKAKSDDAEFPGIVWPGDEFDQPNQLVGVSQIRLPVTSRVYLVPAELLGGRLPAKGDRITEAIQGAAMIFEVMPTDIGQAWTYSDTGRTRFRVHTKRVSE
jgi:hypothetical protein